MELEQLRQLITIQHLGTVSAAAKELAISQSALSRSVQRLEKELDTPLFERGKNSIAFNEVGCVAVEHAEKVLNEAQLLLDAVNDQARRARALRVGTCAPAPLWNLTARMVERFPNDILMSETLTEQEIEQRVLNGSLDFGISRKPFLLPIISNVKLMTETISLAVMPGHPLAKKEAVTFADLDGMDFLLLENIGVWQDFQHVHLPHSHFYIQNDREVFEQLAQASGRPIFVSDIPSQRHLYPDRVRIPIAEPQATATFYLVTSQNASAHVQEIASWVTEQESGQQNSSVRTLFQFKIDE